MWVYFFCRPFDKDKPTIFIGNTCKKCYTSNPKVHFILCIIFYKYKIILFKVEEVVKLKYGLSQLRMRFSTFTKSTFHPSYTLLFIFKENFEYEIILGTQEKLSNKILHFLDDFLQEYNSRHESHFKIKLTLFFR